MEAVMVIGVAVVVLGVLIGTLLFNRDARIKRALRKAPLVRVADFAEGSTGRVVGKVRMLEEHTAPLSGRPCAHYHLFVQVRRSSGRSSHWVTLINEHRMVDFVVEDETGRAAVETAGARIAVVKDAKARSGLFNSASPELQALLEARGHSSKGLLGFNKAMRYSEGVIEEGELVAVYGRASYQRQPGDSRRTLVIGPPDQGSVLISDHPSTTRA